MEQSKLSCWNEGKIGGWCDRAAIDGTSFSAPLQNPDRAIAFRHGLSSCLESGRIRDEREGARGPDVGTIVSTRETLPLSTTTDPRLWNVGGVWYP